MQYDEHPREEFKSRTDHDTACEKSVLIGG